MPVRNEVDNVAPLIAEIAAALDGRWNYEIIYVNDGSTDATAERLKSDARAVQDAGADMVVLECVPAALAGEITRALRIPTIGIGAGADCDGQILVIHDLLGITPGKRPRFSKDFLAGTHSVVAAIADYARAVRSREFPAAEHSY